MVRDKLYSNSLESIEEIEGITFLVARLINQKNGFTHKKQGNLNFFLFAYKNVLIQHPQL